MVTDPELTSYTILFKNLEKKTKKTCDTCHVTHDRGHGTHVKCEIGNVVGGAHSLKNFRSPVPTQIHTSEATEATPVNPSNLVV